ncbi:peptidoglycan DD-metalloendopeptidase family protein [Spirosoma sp. RP8]|uniref:Peptidoglycan DD-metalloendopeptidase family protein n=1 Tax=Spirosoma liriopis TaxID=2937440 RepID=A0ABT0HGG2_9BACT|nr:peptidoglycan DD-metalloendopeptidase family protein [Spirosoma liriopis]MCK8491251.1 peptidoglycan DD-metalloendopeptidase family protein [Spirosoma liriopis]
MLLPFLFQKDAHPVKAPYVVLDFSATNPDLATLDLTDTVTFTDYVFGKLREAGAQVGVGGYNEHRVIYRRSAHFNTDEEPREIHLGIDFWAEAGTPVYAPLAGNVHSFQDNDHFGDYGPTIILEHTVDGKPLYSLYGHLTRSSLEGLSVGKRVEENEQIAEIGPYPENGDWPPHLHFQLMTDMLGNEGDFPGVCSVSDRAKFLAICPNPNDLLGIPGLS